MIIANTGIIISNALEILISSTERVRRCAARNNVLAELQGVGSRYADVISYLYSSFDQISCLYRSDQICLSINTADLISYIDIDR